MQPCLNLSYPPISLLENDIENAWKLISSKSKELILNKKCTQCQFRPICKTCVANAQLETGCYDGTPDYLCQYSPKVSSITISRK